MKHYIISIFAFIVLGGFTFQEDLWDAPKEAKQLENPYAENDAKAIAKGKKIFQKICWTCHGVEAKGDGPAGVNLVPKPTDLTTLNIKNQKDGELFWKVSNGKAVMPAYKDLLSENQRWQLVTYIKTLSK